MNPTRLMMTYEKRRLVCDGCVKSDVDVKGDWEFLTN